MTRILIAFALCAASTCALFAQTEIKATSELQLTIYQGNAYESWYANNHGTDKQIREIEADLAKAESGFDKELAQVRLDAIRERKLKGDKKEKKAVAIHSVNFPISFVFRKNENKELPWIAQAVELENNGVYEDDFFKIEITNIKLADYTYQNTFNLSAKITNKHVTYPNVKAELVHDILDVVYSLTVRYEDGKFDEVQYSHWAGGSVYRNNEPRIYKTDGKLYSFVPFLDRFEEAVIKNVEETLKE